MVKRDEQIPLILDTDIGSDIDDAVCLAYLLRQPRCELLGITTVTGQPRERASLAAAICDAMGRGDIPIHVGCPEPLTIKQKQAKATQYESLVGKPHRTDFPREHAVEFLRKTIRANPGQITLLAIGPMTNVAVLFAIDPEIPSLLKDVVLMAGAFREDIGDGKGGRKSEWNMYCDPSAAASVYYHSKPLSFGLDVTLQCQWPAAECRAWFSAGGAAMQAVGAMAEVWFKHAPTLTFHDPLAAASIFAPELCVYQQGQVDICLEAPETPGVTRWTPDENGPHRIATSVNVPAFFDRIKRTFAL